MTKPIRIQRKRTKGWKMPPNTVYVGRPSKWGNPFSIKKYGRIDAMRRYRGYVERGALDYFLEELRGKNLACWCSLADRPCHADILLELANKP